MYITEVTEVCRLCLKNDNLVYIFDKQCENTENLKDVIFITTGVEIKPNDVVSQKICKKCMNISIKMDQFRETSLKNDKFLKEKYKELIKNDGVNNSTNIKSETATDETETKPLSNSVHPSVAAVFKSYPNIKLPKMCVKMNFAPWVAMPINEVESYFKQRNRNMQHYIVKSIRHEKHEKSSKTDEKKMNNEKNTVVEKNKSVDKNKLMDKNKPVDKIIPVDNIIPVDKNKPIDKSKPVEKSSQLHDKSTKQNVISPISIKLTNPQRTEYKIVKNDDDSRKIAVKSDLKRKFSSRDNTPEGPTCSNSKKRRISDSSSSSEKKENAKPNLIESLGLTPSKHKSKAETESPVIPYEQKTLEICNICNSVQYNVKDLKKHKLKHLRCQFCKSRFKTMELKEEHIEKNCIIKKTMNGLPDVNLTKIEYDLKIRQKYPNAFTLFPPITGLVISNENVTKDSNSKNNSVSTKCSTSKTVTHVVSDVIEILSDDEETRSTIPKDSNKPNEMVATVTHVNKSVPNPQSDPSLPSTSTLSQVLSAQNNDPTSVLSSSSVVKPDIKIKNNYILDTIDPKASDMTILKELLKNYRKIQLLKDTAIQTELPTNTMITTNTKDFSTILKDLKNQLHVYRIPVEIKHGSYKVSFNYVPEEKKQRKMLGWNHLTPIDLKTPANIARSNSSLNQQSVSSRDHSSSLGQLASSKHTNSSMQKTVAGHQTYTGYDKIQKLFEGIQTAYSSPIQLTSPSNSVNTATGIEQQSVIKAPATAANAVHKQNNTTSNKVCFPMSNTVTHTAHNVASATPIASFNLSDTVGTTTINSGGDEGRISAGVFCTNTSVMATVLTNTGHNLVNSLPVGSSYSSNTGRTFQTNTEQNISNTSLVSKDVLVPQNAAFSVPTQVVCQPNPSASVMLNPQNNYLTYNNNSNLYKTTQSNENHKTLPQLVISSASALNSVSFISSETVPITTTTSSVLCSAPNKAPPPYPLTEMSTVSIMPPVLSSNEVSSTSRRTTLTNSHKVSMPPNLTAPSIRVKKLTELK